MKKLIIIAALILIATGTLVVAMKKYNFGFFAYERLGEHIVEGGDDIYIIDETENDGDIDANKSENDSEKIDDQEDNDDTDEPEDTAYKQVQLGVPYLNESPDGSWTGPWKNACEEASITMIESYYQDNLDVTVEEAMDFMMMLFNAEDEIWGSNLDADAARTERLVNEYTSFNAVIQVDPTIDQIKRELAAGHPVISFHYGKDLNNPGIPFLATGSFYHVQVIIGYDDETQEFITNDDGDIRTGAAHRYDYELFMNSLHDFNFETKKPDKPPTVIFTSF
ncbi:MAG: C39 family peptidase [Patescibacteria group bacterium]